MEEKLKQIKGILNDFELGHLTKYETIKSIISWQTYHAGDTNEELKNKIKQANEFILEIAELLKIDVDGIGYDGLQLFIEDFENALRHTEDVPRDEEIKKQAEWLDVNHHLDAGDWVIAEACVKMAKWMKQQINIR